MCLVSQSRIYYEVIAGVFYLCDAGNVYPFDTFNQLQEFVEETNPHAELIEVNESNWQSLYDRGEFHA